MAALRPVGTWLERFRRAAAVPAAATDDLRAELMPVFAALGELEVEAAAVLDEAHRTAERRRAAAAEEAERLLAQAQRRAAAERARAEAERSRAASSEAKAIEREAAEEAARIRARGEERVPALARAVVAALLEEP